MSVFLTTNPVEGSIYTYVHCFYTTIFLTTGILYQEIYYFSIMSYTIFESNYNMHSKMIYGNAIYHISMYFMIKFKYGI